MVPPVSRGGERGALPACRRHAHTACWARRLPEKSIGPAGAKMGVAMSRHRIAIALAATASLAACERSGQPPAPKAESLAAISPERLGLRTDSGLVVEASAEGGPAGGDGIRPVPGATGIRP